MGITLHRFYLYPPPSPSLPSPLVRVLRPAAPNAAQPAVDYADSLADAKADLLVRSWLAAAGETRASPPAPLGSFTPYLDEDCAEDRALLAFHGHELDLWWTADEARPSHVAIGPGGDEDMFWRWLDESVDDPMIERLRRPAAPLRVRLLTEADARLIDHPLLIVEDVDWMTAEEFDRWHRGGELTTVTATPLPTQPPVTERELRLAKLALVERAMRAELDANDRRAASFRCSQLARFDPAAALRTVEHLEARVTLGDDRRGIAWALAYALHQLRDAPAQAELVTRWRARPSSFRKKILAELEKLSASRR